MIDPEGIISRFYPVGGITRELLLRHGELVADKALAVLDRAPWLDADRAFVVQAAMLHDIGIGRTHCPELGCTGALPYVCHGVEGRDILDRIGLKRHGLVCERHVGVGIRVAETLRRNLPLPDRDMVPLSPEERLICYADKFFSKTDNGRHEKRIAEISAGLNRFSPEYGARFMALHRWLTRSPARPQSAAGG
ncbi:HD domain-containing protein [uncultured Desulfosarcina sp.]|uniref:HD domain-containing protein n=1 Tax=uncultured Desulfosarcina sp. TaxID=218289 RepID=UPI0029C8A2D3|nr:HD domain-containing protein [uncultured Desulfosarcina sp.]